MTKNIIEEFLEKHDYDIRKTRNGRWIDQKCIYDEVCFVADCIMDYLNNDGTQPFTSPQIWHMPYSMENVMHVFGKPDPSTDTVIDEYNKFFRQPMKMLAAAGVLSEKKVGITIQFSVVNPDMLEFIALRERNAFDFICLYVEKTLKDSGLWDAFASFYDEQTEEQYDNVKTKFASFCKRYTPINTDLESNRIFTTVINQLACKYHKKGTFRGKISKKIITLDRISYNKPNWYDELTGKDKNVSRQDYEIGNEFVERMEDPALNYQVNRVIKYYRAFMKKYFEDEPEITDVLSIGEKQNAIHHIFPKHTFPQIAAFLENLIALTSAQHMQEAHPGGNTKAINRAFQYTCLIAKVSAIKKNLEGDGSIPIIYNFRDFMYVLDVGLNTDYFESIPDNDYKAVLMGIETNYKL